MPQNENMSEEWQQELGPNWEAVREKYLHTIGNLTLTGYNSELSDRPFGTKRTMPGGFTNSPIQLNQSVAIAPKWDEEAIIKRADMLADWATKIWMVPPVAMSGSPDITEPEDYEADEETVIAQSVEEAE